MRIEDREAIRENFLGVEDGHIYFFYYPKSTEAQTFEEVEHISLILHPFDTKHFRLISLNAAALPRTDDHFNMTNGIVQKVDDKQSVIIHELQQRHQQILGVPQVKKAAARPCGEGVYTILFQENRAHLIYILELPRLDGKVKEALNIGSDGAFTIGIYNPYLESGAQAMNSERRPHFPEDLKTQMKDQRILYDNLPRLLNYENSRLAIFKEPDFNIKQIKPKLHPLADSSKTADIFSDLKLQREKYPVEPLFKGEWR
ncbi:MAG TPA: hypothetical protein VHP36_04965 [Chitinispirillaceae bacterium]|nr:hypothetical protein [Chitinispirillaceae bacterium]